MSKENNSKEPRVIDDFVVEFRKYRTELTTKYLNRKPWQPVDESKVLSFIPGTINKIYVEEGQQLKPGDPILILEAMKMKNILYASLQGKVRKILVSEGDLVPKSKVLLELDLN